MGVGVVPFGRGDITRDTTTVGIQGSTHRRLQNKAGERTVGNITVWGGCRAGWGEVRVHPDRILMGSTTSRNAPPPEVDYGQKPVFLPFCLKTGISKLLENYELRQENSAGNLSMLVQSHLPGATYGDIMTGIDFNYFQI